MTSEKPPWKNYSLFCKPPKTQNPHFLKIFGEISLCSIRFLTYGEITCTYAVRGGGGMCFSVNYESRELHFSTRGSAHEKSAVGDLLGCIYVIPAEPLFYPILPPICTSRGRFWGKNGQKYTIGQHRVLTPANFSRSSKLRFLRNPKNAVFSSFFRRI